MDEREMCLQRLMEAVFGESEDEDCAVDQQRSELQEWERVANVQGLWICRNFLSQQAQQELLEDIKSESWFVNPEDNQAMRFGRLPPWAMNLAASICSSLKLIYKEISLPAKVLSRAPLFDQMIVNLYQPSEGIGAHVDLLRFEDGVAIVSLISARVMTFKPVTSKADDLDHEEVPVLLLPGDLLIMYGEARYDWTHEISSQKQVWDGVPVDLDQRISVTLRRLCEESS